MPRPPPVTSAMRPAKLGLVGVVVGMGGERTPRHLQKTSSAKRDPIKPWSDNVSFPERTINEMDRARILVVDDEPGIVDVLTFALEEAGFETLVATDGPAALRMALTESPALLLLDVMLPGLDGLTVCREIRAVSDLPIILLTARSGEADRIAGLELHADDYVVKPFSIRELIARIRTILRRSPTERSVGTSSNSVVSVGLLELDVDTFEARWSGELIGLSRLQFDLLMTLAKRPRMVFTREQLLHQVWGTDFTDDVRTVDSMVKRLRTRLREAGAPSEIITSKRDLGYTLDPAVCSPSS
jgi:two-component system, OmpR family, response regulator VicR